MLKCRFVEDWYTHYKKGGKYWIEGACSIQVDDEWVPAVRYSNDSGMEFVRSEVEFNAKFTKETCDTDERIRNARALLNDLYEDCKRNC